MSAPLLDPTSIPLKQPPEGNIWSTLAQVTQIVIFFLCICAMLLFFLPVIDVGKSQKDRNLELQRKINAEQERQRELALETLEMKTNPIFVERVSRDRLDLGKPYETIIRFDPYQPEPTTDSSRSEEHP